MMKPEVEPLTSERKRRRKRCHARQNGDINQSWRKKRYESTFSFPE